MIKKILLCVIFFFFLFQPAVVYGAPCAGRCMSRGSCPCGSASGTCQGDDICCAYCPTNTPKPTTPPVTCNGVCQENGHICACGPGVGTCQGNDICCAPCPTNTPTPACVPNESACQNNNQCCSKNCFHNVCLPILNCFDKNLCATVQAVCEYSCETCRGTLTNGYKEVRCWVSQACKDAEVDPCSIEYHIGAPRSQCPDLCAGVTPVPSSEPIDPTCQQTTCYDMGHFMCNVGFPNCPDGIGHCDNCGGKDCGTCSGAPPGSTPVPTQPSCIHDCWDPAKSPCISNTCSDDTCLGNCNQNCYGTLDCPLTTLADFQIRRGSDWFYTERNDGLLLDNPET